MKRPLGVLLAGGDGRRLGGDKAVVRLDGKPLAQHVLERLAEVFKDVVIVARADTALPSLSGIDAVWVEPDGPRHPAHGIAFALEQAGNRPIVVCGLHLPLVWPDLLRSLAARPGTGADATVVRDGAIEHWCLARYEPRAASALRLGRANPFDALDANFLDQEPGDPRLVRVHAPEDLLRASAYLLAAGVPDHQDRLSDGL